MKGQAIPDSDHVGRYCKASTVENGEISAFMMGETEEYLSVNWLEELKRPSRASQIRDLQEVYNKKLKVGATARIAILNVGTLRSKVQRARTAGYSAYCTNRKSLMAHPTRGFMKFPMTMKLSPS
jgi:hypothetical protein